MTIKGEMSRIRMDDSGTAAISCANSFRAGILSEESRASLRLAYQHSQPYKHVVIPSLINDELLRAVREECLHNLHATHKETDIYRVFQTGDLANLDGLDAKELDQLKNLKRLRDALYSEDFRRFVEHVTGVERLSPSKCDLSHNIYRNGCHLICHDDVIGTRSVSYIIYLTDPEEPWLPEEGGALELYPVISKGTPAVDPNVIIPVEWNQLAMFAVQPGLSFHSVAEVVSKPGRDRLSISGWFHVLQPEDMTEEERLAKEAASASETEEEKAKASLDQLTSGDDSKPFIRFPTVDTSKTRDAAWTDAEDNDLFLSDEEIAQLKPFVNPRYLDPTVVSQANEKFCEESSIQLVSFLRHELADVIQNAINEEDRLDSFLHRPQGALAPVADYTKGVRGAWTPTGPAHKCRFLELSDTSSSSTSSTSISEAPLTKLRTDLFNSSAFRHLLYLITSLRATASRGWVRRFRPGMDYTLATTAPEDDESSTDGKGILDATLCFVADKTDDQRKAWASDDFGGFECYMAPDEGNEDPAQYRAADVGGGGALLSVSARNNTLTLVMREPGLMKFIKYVGASAPGSRWDAAWEYKFEE
ncbi:Oxoglutarate and iron-dependent oxygenase degradation C-term-domain-containing protein [Chytridium lagenaria]|nr:Oxoglutarate and iron-dependent oxygenase degradation C-term-domain-containing protein [Chytridium lagenaria]